MRNAEINRFEIEDEPDQHKRHELQRDRDVARDEFIRMYRNCQRRGTLDSLHWRIRDLRRVFEGAKWRSTPGAKRRRALELAPKTSD